MRNRNMADNIDVEIYFKDFKKLHLKMTTMDPAPADDPSRTLSRQLVEKHEMSLQKQKSDVTSAHPKQAFLLEWGLKFCDYAKARISQTEQQKELDRLNAQLQDANDDLNTYQAILDFASVSAESSGADSTIGNRFEQVKQMVAADEQQAREYQDRLERFDATFEELLNSTAAQSTLM